MTSRFNAWAVAFAAVALLGAGACNRADQPAERQQTAAQPGGEPSDTVVTTNVQARYYADQTIRGRHIDVSTNNGVVTLRGAVDSEQSRAQAIQIARQVEGVRDVRDELRIEPQVAEQRPDTTGTPAPTSATNEGRAELGTARDTREGGDRNPGWITTKIQAQYFVTPDVRPWNVDVTTTSNGVVTLSGEVENEEGRRKAVEIAQATEGVTRVDDQLRLRSETAATAGRDPETGNAAARDEEAPEAGERDMADSGPLGDAWLTTKVQSKFFLDDEVKGRAIDVSTLDGLVTLSGTVRTEAEKRQAVAIARNTDGVRQVNDQLRVDESVAGTAGETPGRTDWNMRSVENPFGDEWLTTKIQSKFYLEDSVRGADINVDTREGVVTLKGTVPSAEARQTAEQIARSTAGVKRVDSQLQVAGQAQR